MSLSHYKLLHKIVINFFLMNIYSKKVEYLFKYFLNDFCYKTLNIFIFILNYKLVNIFSKK